jgi:enoyl-CoA hydratase/carnithine racemase
MTDPRVRLDIQNGVAIITLDRPERRNALCREMWQAIGARADEAASSGVRALILTGTGDHFCAGMDLKPDNAYVPMLMPAISDGNREVVREIIHEIKDSLSRLQNFPAPTIAAIEGACLGGGYEVALRCDVRIAGQSAKLGLPEVRMGMVPDVGGTHLLTRLVGKGRAAMVICSGAPFDTDQAERLGMVEQVVADGQSMATAKLLAGQIALGGPVSVRAAIQAIRQIPGMSQEAACVVETEAGIDAVTSGEPMEGIMSFAERRPPRW